MKARKSAKAKPAKARQKRNADITRAKILRAAISEFGERGFAAASTDDMAERSGVNKRMIYYYYGNKEGVYLAALESVFENLVTCEREIKVEDLDPAVAIETIINLKIDYYLQNPHFVSFLSMENLCKARHLRKSKKLAVFRATLTDLITRILNRGQHSGQFRTDIEPVDFYVSMCALCIMYFSNQHTLGVIFEREMMTRANLERRRRTVIDFVLGYLRAPKVIEPVSAGRGRRVPSLVS
jgi:TetR/AcrR family transcriptional regulator